MSKEEYEKSYEEFLKKESERFKKNNWPIPTLEEFIEGEKEFEGELKSFHEKLDRLDAEGKLEELRCSRGHVYKPASFADCLACPECGSHEVNYATQT